MQKYNQILNAAVPQTEQQYPNQVPNAAGGWSFEVDHWTQLRRFLVLGTIGGTYYISERDLTKANVDAVDKCIAEDAKRVALETLDISDAGRALKNDPAIFVLAKLAVAGGEGKKQALDALRAVCRIPTHLFHFIAYYDGLGGKWGRQLRTAVANWYVGRDPKQLAYHLTKYQSRDGWSNKDLIKLSHPATEDPDQDFLFRRELGKDTVGMIVSEGVGNYISAVDSMHSDVISTDGKLDLIQRHRLPREVLPTELLNDRRVWEAMLPEMPTTALVRNLGKLTALGVIGPMSQWNSVVAGKLTSPEALAKARVHPLQLLIALKQYESGAGFRGSLSWRPDTLILNALEEGFYTSFRNVQPIGKRVLFALDESGSMRTSVSDVPNLSCAQAGAAVLCVLNSVEPQMVTLNFATRVRQVHHSRTDRLTTVMREYSGVGDGTDCAAPINWALTNKVPVDLFVMFTDSETWAGYNHPEWALREYRKTMNIPSKIVVCAAVANSLSVFDNDPLSLTIPGFDAALPQIVREFALI